jgi:hypothetical protein
LILAEIKEIKKSIQFVEARRLVVSYASHVNKCTAFLSDVRNLKSAQVPRNPKLIGDWPLSFIKTSYTRNINGLAMKLFGDVG